MHAKDELVRAIAEQKGQMVAGKFAKYLRGLITWDEFSTAMETQEHHFETIVKELNQVSDVCIQSVMLALDR